MLREQWIRHKNMEIKSEQKYLIISPRKVRPVVDVIKKLSPIEAISKSPFVKRYASEYLLKVIKSAVANATSRGIDSSRLVFKEIQIGEGPRLRRGNPVSRGRWHPIKKRMSHIKVILTTKIDPVKAEKVETKKVKEAKVEVKKTVAKKPATSVKKIRKVNKNVAKS